MPLASHKIQRALQAAQHQSFRINRHRCHLLIQYAAEEAIAAGITELVFVTSSSKRAIEDHFDRNFELESTLKARGKEELLADVRGILLKGVHCVYMRQPEALGLGHAVLCAKNVVGNNPFAVILADNLIDDDIGLHLMEQAVPWPRITVP